MSALNPCPRSIQVGDFEVAIGGGIWVAIRAQGARAMEASAAATHRYSAGVDPQPRRRAFGLDGVSNWYKSASGRVTQNWPFSTVDFWRQMQAVNTEDFLFWP